MVYRFNCAICGTGLDKKTFTMLVGININVVCGCCYRKAYKKTNLSGVMKCNGGFNRKWFKA